jgi:uncharacterized damage-inducible protein DinB
LQTISESFPRSGLPVFSAGVTLFSARVTLFLPRQPVNCMKSASAPTATNLRWNLSQSLVESYQVNESANQMLLLNVSDGSWRAATPRGKGRTIAALACHIHNVRLMWLSAADQKAKKAPKLDDQSASREEVMRALTSSARAVSELIVKGVADPGGKIPNFKPDVVVFVGYLIAHDAHHRGQIAMLARQLGHPLPAKAGFALWEWGTLWKNAGFTR